MEYKVYFTEVKLIFILQKYKVDIWSLFHKNKELIYKIYFTQKNYFSV